MITMVPYGLRSLPNTARTRSRLDDVATTIYAQQVRRYLYPYRPTLRLSSTSTTASAGTDKSNINPPSSTLPAPLDLPSRFNYDYSFKYYYWLSRAYIRFYKTGAKAVFTNYQSSRTMLARLPPSTSPPDALADGLLSRAEWQLIRRSRHDMKKVPLFALIFMICGEFTPVVVMAISSVVPRTCKIPKQVQNDRQKAEIRRSTSFHHKTLTDIDRAKPSTSDIHDLRPDQVIHIGRSLGLYSAVWDRLGLNPTSLIRRRIGRWKQYIDMDDAVLTKTGGLPLMEAEEMRIASEERGLDTLGMNDKQLMEGLRAWLSARKRMDVTRLLLARPSGWAE